jgi:hypothetical protein
MKMLKAILFIASAVLLIPLSSYADDDFYGIIESIPEDKIGTWAIGGRQIVVMERTQLDEDHGPLVVGACAEIEYEGSLVEEIESEGPHKCGKYAVTLHSRGAGSAAARLRPSFNLSVKGRARYSEACRPESLGMRAFTTSAPRDTRPERKGCLALQVAIPSRLAMVESSACIGNARGSSWPEPVRFADRGPPEVPMPYPAPDGTRQKRAPPLSFPVKRSPEQQWPIGGKV